MPEDFLPLCWMHIGDLHITDARLPNHDALLELVRQANRNLGHGVAFAVLPGDNADDGTRTQFGLVKDAVDQLDLPLHILPGDHDFKSRSLAAFYEVLCPERLPKAIEAIGYLCLFLDVVSAGDGGPDFRLGSDQLDWLQRTLTDAEKRALPTVIFMHTYPADLGEDAAAFMNLVNHHHVVAVDMGHTHYNELSNDGRRIYAATRSTGQIEEGDAGFSVVALDHGGFAWRFKTLDAPWPLVLITSPTDRRLVITEANRHSATEESTALRAMVWSGEEIMDVSYRLDEGDWTHMTASQTAPLWSAAIEAPPPTYRVTVRAMDRFGNTATDAVEIASASSKADIPRRQGSDAHSIGAWPEKHLLGTQLGPNRNGRKW